MIYVLSGSSGVGKTTIEKELRKEYDFKRPKSYTTRPKRDDSNEYIYVDEEKFKELIRDKGVLEYTQYAGNYYGTSLFEIESILRSGGDIVLVLDINGGYAIKRRYPKLTKLIYILAPNKETLKDRLIKRGTESANKIEERLSLYDSELKGSKDYDFFVTNYKLSETIEQVKDIINADRKG